MRTSLLVVLSALMTCLAGPAAAWWNKDWLNRSPVSITSPVAAAVEQAPVLIRLHTGNFPFADAKIDGSDVRVVAGDDTTPLKFHIEKWDGLNELALLWVQLPMLAPGAPNKIFIYSGNPEAVGGEDTKGTWDPYQIGAFHFRDGEPTPTDSTAQALQVTSFTAMRTANSLVGGGLALTGQGGMTLASTPSTTFSGGLTVSTWVKLTSTQSAAVLFRQKEGLGPIEVGIEGLRPYVNTGTTPVTASADLTLGTWTHIAVSVADRVILYVDGVEAAVTPATPGGSAGIAEIAVNMAGEIDEFLLANRARSPDWLRFAAKSQQAGSQVVVVGTAETTEGADSSYLAILLGAVTVDGWVVIVILMIMMVISFVIMIAKAVLISRTDKANRKFVGAFRKMGSDLTSLQASVAESANHAAGAAFPGSNLYRIYKIGIDELGSRISQYKQRGEKLQLSPQAIGAIRATLDAGLVKESHRLNSQMVLLTIAISGGPFLGLLGTVVGVMITFAAIAAAGDVNVNSIAPGIAAALVATVAGLAVAIPALFGYNYLSSRIKSVVADMNVFADELITKLAEGYAG